MGTGIVQQVIEAQQAAGIKAVWKTAAKGGRTPVEGNLHLKLGKQQLTLPAEVKKNITPALLPALHEQKKELGNLLILTGELGPREAKQLRDMGIFYLDRAGNAFISQDSIYIHIEGKKTAAALSKETRAFSKGGLTVIFQLFLQDHLLGATMREMAGEAGVSLDTVHKTITALKRLRYIAEQGRNRYIWINKKELLDRWVTEYDTRLRPGQFVHRFDFIDDKDFDNWQKIKFRDPLTCWGAEPAADMLTGNVKPGELRIYTYEDNMELVQRYRMMPKKAGAVAVYRRFWPKQPAEHHTAPALLVYADLVGMGERRHIETAQKIYERYLQDQFQAT